MVTVRRRAAISYKEATRIDGLEDGSDEEQEQQEEPRPPQARKAIPSKPRARKRPAVEAGDLEEASLLDIVKKHGTSIAVAAKDWVDRYRESRGAATAELLSFLLQACGVDRVLSEEEGEEGEVDALKQELDAQAQEEGLEDHWHGARAASKAFRANYLELWDKVVREASGVDVLWDQYLLDKLTSLLVALNTSVVRDFRTVATLTAAQLVTSWIHVSLALGEARDTAERQLAAEEKKKSKNAQRVVDFRRTRDGCHTHVQELKSYTDSLFQGIFAHRFRDCSEEIRATVIEGIGAWVRLHPAAFLTDQYLKYIAWALSDKDARVRLASVTALLSLYGNPDNGAALADFTQRFAQRFGELFYDADERVAVKGVQLNTLLVRLKEAQPSQYARVYELLADESASIRHAVAELVASALEDQGLQVLQAAAAKSGGKKPRRKSGEGVDASAGELQLAGLLQVLHMLANPAREGAAGGGDDEEQEAAPLLREVVAQVVDALFESVPVLSDWHLMLSWAQQGQAEEHFGEAGVTNLLHLLHDALRKATGGTLAAGGVADHRGGGGMGGHKGKERKELQAAARQDATLALMKDLPALLRKVQTDPAQAAALVGVIPEMKLEVYSLKQQEKAFSQLASGVKDTLLKHADAQVARECVAALAACVAYGPDSIKDAASLALSECAADVASGLATAVGALERVGERGMRAAAEAYERSGGEEESQVLYDARASLVRLHALLELGGGTAADDDEVYDALHALLENTASGGTLPASLVVAALRSQMLVLMWHLRQLDPEFPNPAGLQALARQRQDYVMQLESIAECSASQDVKDDVAGLMTDVFLVFSASKLAGSALEQAAFSPSDDTVAAFWGLCQDMLRREVEVNEEDDSAAIATKMAAQRCAANRAAMLAVFQAVPQHAWLAAQLLSQWVGPEAAASDGAVRRWTPVADVVKETARLLKKTDTKAMPSIYLEALKAAYKRMPTEPAEPTDEEQEALPPGQEFLALSDRIAKTYAGFNSSASALEHIIMEGSKHALREGPEHLGFLEGVAFFVRSLPVRSAEQVQRRVEAAAVPQRPRDGDADWDTYYAFLDCLAKRAAKGHVKSVLKTAEGGAAGTTKAPRKISFAAPRDAIEEGSEEEEEWEAIEEPDEWKEPRRSGSGGRRQGRLSGMTPGNGRGGSRRGAAAAAAAAEAEADTDNELEAPPWGQQVLADVPEAVEEGESEGEEPEVLPTEEAMAIPGTRSGGKGKPRRHKLRSLFAEEEVAVEEAQEQQEQEDEDDDADLQVPYGHTRGGSQKQAAVVDPQPQLGGGDSGGDESEEEERPARRRRR